MGAGRPRQVDPGTLYAFAHQFYWDLKTIDEGLFRIHRNRKLMAELEREAEATKLTEEQSRALDECVEDEVRRGITSEGQKEQRLTLLQGDLLADIKFGKLKEASEISSEQKRVPGEPDIIDSLLAAEAPEAVKKICEDAFTTRVLNLAPEVLSNLGIAKEQRVPNWPISAGSTLPMYLSQFAPEFIAAKNDKRFPKSPRPTNRLKQLWFLSRALAGALYGIKTRTAINLIGSRRPDQMAEFSKGKRKTKRTRRRKL